MIIVCNWGIDVLMFGSLIMLVLGVLVILFNLVSVLLICCFLVKYLGKLVIIWFVNEILWVLILIFVVFVYVWMIGNNEYVVRVGVLFVLV